MNGLTATSVAAPCLSHGHMAIPAAPCPNFRAMVPGAVLACLLESPGCSVRLILSCLECHRQVHCPEGGDSSFPGRPHTVVAPCDVYGAKPRPMRLQTQTSTP